MSEEPGRPPISGVVICFNEERNIARCLESLSFCDEIVVVDSNSTDATREIASQYTDRLIVQEFLGFQKQKQLAVEHARHDWIVSLDADEVISPELATQIKRAIARDDGRVSGYRLDRMTHYLGIWHDAGEWYPDWKLRVFRRSRGRWTGRAVHEYLEVDGPVEALAGRLEHWNYRDLSDHLQTIDRFSAAAAEAMHAEGARFRVRDLLFRPLGRFVRGYFLRRGFRKGLPGLIVSLATSFHVFMKYAKLWELERRERR